MNPKLWHHDPVEEQGGRSLKPLMIPVAGSLLALWVIWKVFAPAQQENLHTPDLPKPGGVYLSGRDHISLSSFDHLQATDLLIDAIIQIESQGDPGKVGSVGERGLMQIREGTWNEVTQKHFERDLPFSRAFEPALNREVGRHYLGDLQVFLYKNRSKWKSDLRSLLLASYNAGPDRVRRSGFDMAALPESVKSYAARGSALHDWYLETDALSMHKLLIEAAESADSPKPEQGFSRQQTGSP